MQVTCFQVEHPCPQCGGPIIIEETDSLFTCEFCRVTSLLLTDDYFHFLLPHNAPRDKSLIYVPYWRFKGLRFSCLNDEIREQIVDVSYEALGTSCLPPSLGLRSQALRLRYVAPGVTGHFIKPHLSYDDFLHLIETRFDEFLPGPVFNRSLIGETRSLIYAPFYADPKLYDALLNRPVSPDPNAGSDLMARESEVPSWQVRFMPAICPECGWNLEGRGNALVLLCRNCNSAWQARQSGFEKINFALLAGGGASSVYLPFYRFRTEMEGIVLDSWADLIKLANLPKVARPESADRPFYFWFPAFKIRPADLLGLSQTLTLTQPQSDLEPRLPEGTIHPVTLSTAGAIEGLKTTLAGIAKPHRIMFPRLSEIRIRPVATMLVYLPFQLQGDELSLPALWLRLNRNLLTFAHNL